MWINLTPKELEVITDALRSSKGDGPASEDDLRVLARLREWEIPGPNDEAYRGAVETSDDLEVDEDAVVSPGSDPGAWVHAWIWVTDEQAGIEPEDEEEGEDGQAEETA